MNFNELNQFQPNIKRMNDAELEKDIIDFCRKHQPLNIAISAPSPDGSYDITITFRIFSQKISWEDHRKYIDELYKNSEGI